MDAENEETREKNDSLQHLHTGVQYDTCLQPVDIVQEVLDHYFNYIYNIAPTEGKHTVQLLQEDGNKPKSFTHSFPNGKNKWTESIEKRITLAKYFNNRLMNADGRFAKDTYFSANIY